MTVFSSPPALDPATFRLLQELIHTRYGVYFGEDQRGLLALKLAARLQALGLRSFLDYYYYLKYNAQGESEWSHLAEAITVNETYFWREFDQIAAVAQVLVPQWQAAYPGRTLRIWHAGCASGEEAYTMAIALHEARAFDRGAIEIIGTDINPKSLAQAFKGVYRTRSFRATPPEIQKRYFRPVGSGQWAIREDIRQRVRFFPLNLLDAAQMRRMKPFDVIFCRNVFIYFSSQSVCQVSQWFYESLLDHGYLFLGASESLLKITDRFELVEVGGAFGYRKVREDRHA